jgi:hypothetical protein
MECLRERQRHEGDGDRALLRPALEGDDERGERGAGDQRGVQRDLPQKPS